MFSVARRWLTTESVLGPLDARKRSVHGTDSWGEAFAPDSKLGFFPFVGSIEANHRNGNGIRFATLERENARWHANSLFG